MTYMKILLLLMFCTVLPMQAQQMKKLTDLKDFEARLLQEAKNIESIESNFTQIKYLDVFDEKITSKGKFYYKKSNKICMDYAQPMNYLIVINNNQLKIVSDGKKSIMDLHSNKMMNQMQDMLTACMVGDLSNMSPTMLWNILKTPITISFKSSPSAKRYRHISTRFKFI